MVEDNGKGMNLKKQQEIRQILEKGVEKSIGLNTALKILNEYNGLMGFETEEGLGTIFTISLPKNTSD